MSVTTGVIQNVGEEPITVRSQYFIENDEFISKYGSKIKRGAFVALFNFDAGMLVSSRQFIADRIETRVYLQDNSNVITSNCNIDFVGEIVAHGNAALEGEIPGLETFTVFGENDDGERFTAVISATEETAFKAAIDAGTVDRGWEDDVTIAAILYGDQSTLDQVEL